MKKNWILNYFPIIYNAMYYLIYCNATDIFHFLGFSFFVKKNVSLHPYSFITTFISVYLYCLFLLYVRPEGHGANPHRCHRAWLLGAIYDSNFFSYWQCVCRGLVHSFSEIFYFVSKNVRIPIYVQFFASNILIGDSLANSVTCKVPFWAIALLTNWTKIQLLTLLLTSFTYTLANKFIVLYYSDCVISHYYFCL